LEADVEKLLADYGLDEPAPEIEPESDLLESLESLHAIPPPKPAPAPSPVHDEPVPTLARVAEAPVGEEVPKWVIPVLVAVVLFGIIPGLLWLARDHIPFLREKRPQAEAPAQPPGQAPERQAVPVDELAYYRELGAGEQEKRPLTGERAELLIGYLDSYPEGSYRAEIRLFALDEAIRALGTTEEIPAAVVSRYIDAARLATEEMLANGIEEPADQDVLARFATHMCWHARSPENLELARRVMQLDDAALVRNADLALSTLAPDTPADARAEFQGVLRGLVLRIPPEQWEDRWLDVLMPGMAQEGIESGRGAQPVIRFAVGLHQTGREEKAVALMQGIAKDNASGETRDLAKRWLLCWQPEIAAVFREQLNAEVERRHRLELPEALKTIDHRQLAARLALPWPLPPSPKMTPAEAVAARRVEVEADIAKEFPAGRIDEIKEEAATMYAPLSIGDEVNLQLERDGSVTHVKGRYQSRIGGYVRIGYQHVLLADLNAVDRARFDKEVAEREREAYVDKWVGAFKRRREGTLERLLAKAEEEAPAAAGYVRRGGLWFDPQAIFSQALDSAAETVSGALRERIAKDVFTKAGFEKVAGEWQPVPPKVVSE
jgi:hypothetical protein